jgi:L-ascorbate metabolism protein UlaG (beta-lactamase superfamily)
MSGKSRRKPKDLRADRIAASPRFNGRVFVNTQPVAAGFKKGVERPTLREFLCATEPRIPAGVFPLVDPAPLWSKKSESGLRVTWLGHSTLLIEIDGVRVLTDPVWGKRASPLPFAGPKRFHPPPAPLSALPPLDAVIVSHDHYDHLDRGTVRALARMGVPFITSLGVGHHLERWGIPAKKITEFDWWEETAVRGVTITAGPAQHFSGRGIKDRNATLWSSFHLRGPKHSFFFGADSGLTPDFLEISKRLGPFDVVALEIGAFHPSWGDIHMGPANAVKAYTMLGSGAFLPIHWGTFNLAVHPWDEPPEIIVRLAPAAGAPLVMPKLGQPIEPTRERLVDTWWRTVASKRARVESAAVPARAGDVPLEWLPD